MDGFNLLAKYNQWMNGSIYEKCQKLDQSAIALDQKTFFGSILTTLNHLLIGDIFWLSRCSGDKSFFNLKDSEGGKIFVKSLDQVLYKDIEYQTSKGDTMTNRLEYILLHWFNHQTHHRGQITAMLSQQGVDYGLTDLIYIKDQI